MEKYIEKLANIHVSKVDTKPAKSHYDRRNSMQVDEVALHSMATLLGVQCGDLLLTINGGPAAKKDMWDWAEQSSNHVYVFYQPSQQQELHIHSTGIPLGIKLNKTTDAIVDQFFRWNGDHEDLTVLWERFDWSMLHKVRELWHREAGAWNKLLSIFGYSRVEPSEIDVLYAGVALYETGETERGMEVIENFAEKHAHQWQTTYSGVVLYYRAMETLRRREREEALAAFQYSYDYIDLKPTEIQIRRLGGVPNEEVVKWEGQPLPFTYDLPRYDHREQRCDLASVLSSLNPGELHIVCLLGSYRSNQPYDRFIQRYRVYAKYFDQLFGSLHVITSATKNGHWQEKEDAARAACSRVEILYDEGDDIASSIQLESSPSVFLINRDGVVIMHDSLYTEVKLWECLGRNFEALQGQ